MTRLGFVTGLRTESSVIDAASQVLPQADRPLVFCGGADAGRARAGAIQLIEAGAGALISFGIAGGLAPRLAPGSLVFASAVQIAGQPSLDVDLAWRDRLCGRVTGVLVPLLGDIAGSDRVVQTPAEKKRLFEATHAMAVDMESHVVARVAQDYGIPCLIIRAIADRASATIPDAALAGVGPQGHARPMAVLRRAALTPWVFPALCRLGGAHRKAHGSLRHLLKVAGVNLAFE